MVNSGSFPGVVTGSILSFVLLSRSAVWVPLRLGIVEHRICSTPHGCLPVGRIHSWMSPTVDQVDPWLTQGIMDGLFLHSHLYCSEVGIVLLPTEWQVQVQVLDQIYPLHIASQTLPSVLTTSPSLPFSHPQQQSATILPPAPHPLSPLPLLVTTSAGPTILPHFLLSQVGSLQLPPTPAHSTQPQLEPLPSPARKAWT